MYFFTVESGAVLTCCTVPGMGQIIQSLDYLFTRGKSIFDIWTVSIVSHINKQELTDGANVGPRRTFSRLYRGHLPKKIN